VKTRTHTATSQSRTAASLESEFVFGPPGRAGASAHSNSQC
jgi:hypothetical protein